MFFWVNCALIRSVDNRNAEHDEVLSKVFRLLAREYVRFADWASASELYYYAYLRTSVQDEIPRSYAHHVACTYRWGDPEILPLSIDRFEHGLPEHQHVQRFVQLFRALLNDDIPDRRCTPDWLLEIVPLGDLVYAYSASAVGRWLRRKGRTHSSYLVLGQALLQTLKRSHDPWIVADLEQELAMTALEYDRHEQALKYALKAWVRFDEQRYRISEHRLRLIAWERFSDARHVALTAATLLDDSRTVTELIEACRLQSHLETEMVKESIADENQRASGIATRRQIENQEPAQEIKVPAALFQAYDDSMNATSLTPPPILTFQAASVLREYGDAVHQASHQNESRESVALEVAIEASRSDAWWANHVEAGRLFWSLIQGKQSIVTGYVDISNRPRLASVLHALDKESHSTCALSLESHPGFQCDPLSALASWNSPEERFVTDTLGELVPEPLRDLLLSKGSLSRPVRLTIAAPSEIACVPWPIVTVGQGSDATRRLVECAAVTMWTSATSEITKHNARIEREHGIRFHVSCDDPTGDLHLRDPSLAPRAAYNLGPGLEDGTAVATKEALIDALNRCKDKGPGLFFYRGHAGHYEDPAYSRLALAGGEAIKSGELFGQFSKNSAYLPMPERVILSCCSSSTAALLGGEGIGFIAGLIHAGAREIVATAVDVYDTSFTSALDNLLIEAMLQDGDHAMILRDLHLRLLNEWKVYSVRGLIEYRDDIKDPHPIIWAFYHAY